jgi:hypothetical protein
VCLSFLPCFLAFLSPPFLLLLGVAG